MFGLSKGFYTLSKESILNFFIVELDPLFSCMFIYFFLHDNKKRR